MGSAFYSLTPGLLALLFSALLLGLVASMRSADEPRLSYRLSFPADLDAPALVTWLTSVSGTLRTGPSRLLGVPTLVFEVRADDRGITHHLRVPREQAGFVVPQLRSLVPGMTVTPEDDEPPHLWSAAVELGQSNPARTLGISNPEAVSASVLATMQGLGRKERLLLQWVVAPAVPERLPVQGGTVRSSRFSITGQLLAGNPGASRDEIADRRTKLSQPNYLGVLRVAAQARHQRAADALVGRVQASLASARTPDNRLRPRMVSRKRVIERASDASAPTVFPAQLTVTEMAALLAWPIGHPLVAGLPRSRSRHLPATGAVPRDGRIIARSTFPGDERPLALAPAESAQHLQVVGPTGSGKTALLTNLIAQDMNAGRGVVLIESKGDLYRAALDRVPEGRLQDVVLLDVTDTEHPVGFNILQGSPYVVAADIQRLFDHLYPQDARGVRVRAGFYHLILTLMLSTEANGQMTFADIQALAAPTPDQEQFSRLLVKGVSHVEELAGWWSEITRLGRPQRNAYFKPLLQRIWQLTSRRSLRNIIGQSVSTVDLADIIRSRKILLVNLGRGTEGKDTAGLLGSLLLNSLWSAVQRGVADPINPTMLYLDEFQDFLNLPISPADMFAQARSLGLAMTVAHQHLGQLNRELQDATQTNARSKVVFQTAADEARDFARQFGRSVTEDDFLNLARFEVLMRLATRDGVSSPVTGVTLPPGDETGIADAVRRRSQAVYGRPVEGVETQITARRQVAPAARSKSKRRFGGRPWNAPGEP